MTVERCCQLSGRDGKIGIMELQLSCKDDKINKDDKVLRQKLQLKGSKEFQRTYIFTYIETPHRVYY